MKRLQDVKNRESASVQKAGAVPVSRPAPARCWASCCSFKAHSHSTTDIVRTLPASATEDML